MKKYINIFAVLAMALFVGSCEDELQQAFEPVQIVPGEEILFGACYRPVSADKAPADRTTRTVYGDVYGETNTEKKWIEINWIPGRDHMQIASPQSAGAARGVAEYMVKDSKNDGGASVVTELVRTGAAGLQWGEIAEGTQYDFYAVYPSVNQLKESVADGAESCSLSKDGLLSGYLPTDQSWTDVKSTNNRYIFSPNMDYAYMVAKTNYTINKDEEGAASMGEPISLDFESLVTALQFEIKAGDLNLNNSTEDNHISIISVALFSQSGQQLAGDFKYNIAENATPGLVTKGNTSYSQVIQKFEGLNITLSNEQTSALDLTFFLLPSVENYASGDLRLQIMYEVNGTPQIKTATIGPEIPARVKRYFSNVKLPAIIGEVDASKWFQALNPNVLVSQVSIPVAANTFANSSYGLVNQPYRTQQTLKIDSMWNFGVRGFELCTQSNTPENKSSADCFTYNLDGMPMIAAEQDVTGQLFADQLDLLYNLMFETKDGKTEKTGEPLVLICTYASRSDGYNPMHWIVQLFNSLQNFCTRNSIASPGDIFVQLNTNTTVEDLYGKIAVIIRPGSDERWAYNTSVHSTNGGILYSPEGTTNDPTYLMNGVTEVKTNSPYGYTLGIPLSKQYKEKNRRGDTTPADLPTVITSNDWWNRVLLISDWGIESWDSWHRRFATSAASNLYKYATTATNYGNIPDGRRKITNQEIYEKYIVNGNAPATGNYYYNYDMYMGNSTYGTAYIQDMVRVISEGFSGAVKAYSGTSRDGTKTVHWSESLKEKQKAIEGLFMISVDRSNDDANRLFINNISGYFPTTGYEYYTTESRLGSDYYHGGNVSYFPVYDSEGFKNSGKGGNYLACANKLTPYVYGILSGTSKLSDDKTYLAEGPWGLVMMDYIGTATKSKELVNLIMKNNFAGFELAEKQNEKAKATKVPFSDEEISPELDILVNWD